MDRITPSSLQVKVKKLREAIFQRKKLKNGKQNYEKKNLIRVYGVFKLIQDNREVCDVGNMEFD